MIDRHVIEPILLALVAFAITLVGAMGMSVSLDTAAPPAPGSSPAGLPATTSGGLPSPDAATNAISTFDSAQSNFTRRAMFRLAVLSAASESQEVGRAMHDLLTRPSN